MTDPTHDCVVCGAATHGSTVCPLCAALLAQGYAHDAPQDAQERPKNAADVCPGVRGATPAVVPASGAKNETTHDPKETQ